MASIFIRNTRALCAQTAETDIKRFLIGTQSLKFTNEVHLIEYDDETNALTKCIFDHREGEIWHISASSVNKSHFLTCYNKLNNPNSISSKCAIWSMPDPSQCEMSLAGDDSTHYALNLVAELPVETSIIAMWEPNSGDDTSYSNNIISLSENCIYHFDCNTSAPRLVQSANLEAKGQPKFTNCKWNPHQNCSQIATCNDTAIRGWDLKSMKQTFVIENAHSHQLVRDLDFNSNKQYYLASCGDDCRVKFWDIRKPNECLKTLSNHSHWVWCVRYNIYHDQLLLSSSSDNRVTLYSIPSLSSEPYKLVLEHESAGDTRHQSTSIEDSLSANLSSPSTVDGSRKKEPDRVLKVYEEHEDSVYMVEWAAGDPWIFGSLSYDGRFIINKVPKEEKFKILL